MAERNIWTTSWGELGSKDPNSPEFNFLNLRQPNPNAPLGLKTWADISKGKKGNELAIRGQEDHLMSGGEAALRGLAVIALTKPIRFAGKEIVPADRAQERIIDAVSKQYKRFDIPGRLVFPSKENVEKEVLKVVDAYKNIIPDDALSPPELNERIHRDTLNLLNGVNSGDRYHNHETTKEEKALAIDLTLLIGQVPPEVIKQKLYTATYASAADVVAAEQSYEFAAKQQDFYAGMMNISRIQPSDWFTLDWITSEILMTKEEQNRLQDVQWALSPKSLHVRRIVRGKEDEIAIPLSRFAPGSDGGIYVQDGTLDAIDAMRVAGTRLVQPVVNRLGRDLGGPVHVRSTQRDEPLASFAVRSPKFTAANINNLGALAAGYEYTLSMMNNAIGTVDAKWKVPIRPQEVIKNLPTPLVLEMGAELNQDQSVNWDAFVNQVEDRKKRVKERLLEVSKRAANWLDDEGKPKKSDQRAIDYLKEEIDYLDEEAFKIAGHSKTEKKCAWCGEGAQGNRCSKCGGPNPAKGTIYM